MRLTNPSLLLVPLFLIESLHFAVAHIGVSNCFAFLAPTTRTSLNTRLLNTVSFRGIGLINPHFSKIHEETDDELRLSEDLAAIDAADCSDAGMEAVAEERAIMLANEIFHKKRQQQQEKGKDSKNDWDDQHLAHGAATIHEETDDELREAEDAALADAADCSDAGMEAAMEERAVMLAREMAHKMKEKAQKKNKS